MTYEFKDLPMNVDQIKAIDGFNFNDPKFVAAMFILSLNAFTKDAGKGTEMINLLKGPVDLTAHDTSFLRDRLRGKEYLPASYMIGAKPDNNYSPEQPYKIEVHDDVRPSSEENYLKLFIASGGADSKRPITLRKKGDEYFIWEYSSILLSIVKPKSEDPWA